jgi:hypothetical protein
VASDALSVDAVVDSTPLMRVSVVRLVSVLGADLLWTYAEADEVSGAIRPLSVFVANLLVILSPVVSGCVLLLFTSMIFMRDRSVPLPAAAMGCEVTVFSRVDARP